MIKRIFKCASFFAGVGGIDAGFVMAENKDYKFDTVYVNEFDKYAARTFEENYKSLKVDCRDIRDVKATEIPDFDVMLAGFPCQAFSIAGLRQGFDDEKGRGNLFFELERIFLEKQPKIIFLENVKNLISHDNGNTFKVIKEKLEKAGYYIKYDVLNSMVHGNIPQNRERIYIIAFKDKDLYEKFIMPSPIPLTSKLTEYIDFNAKVEEKYYYKKENCKFFNVLEDSITRSDTVYQWRRVYVRENKSGVCPTLTANMGTGGHNVPLIKSKYGIRKLTPKECFNIQGFNKEFLIPEKTSNAQAYKQAGNSVVVPVIRRIAEEILNIL